MRTVCQQDEYRKGEALHKETPRQKLPPCLCTDDDDDVVAGVMNCSCSLSTAELCRELSGWPRRAQRSTNRKRCSNLRSNRKTWANIA